MTDRLPATRPQHGRGLAPPLSHTLRPGGGHLGLLALRRVGQVVSVLDHLSRQVEAIRAAHPFGEQLDDAGQADSGAGDLAPKLEVAVTSHVTSRPRYDPPQCLLRGWAHVHPERPRDLEPSVLVASGSHCHVIPAVLDRHAVVRLMAGGMALGNVNQLGDDFTACLCAFVGHTTTVDAIERVFPWPQAARNLRTGWIVGHVESRAPPQPVPRLAVVHLAALQRYESKRAPG